MKGDKLVKRSSIGSLMRKTLSDITNVRPEIKPPVIKADHLFLVDSASEEHVENLLRENMALVKLIEDKNKIIELNGRELQKVRVTLQKLQLQNWNLAQVNSHMMAELKLGKDKLKCIQQELMCKEAVLKAMPKVLKEKGKLNGDIIKDGDVAMVKPDSKNNKKQRRAKSQSMENSLTSQKVIERTTADNKRPCLRRKSAGFRAQEQEPPSEDLFEIEDLKFTSDISYDTPTHINGPTPLISSVSNVAKDENQCHGTKSQRTSLGRPSRRAAEKVQSYKEIPLNIKMRRTD